MATRLFLFLIGLFSTLSLHAGLFNKQPQFLPAEQAFAFSYEVGKQQLELHWQIAEGYYLYKKEIEIKGQNAALSEVSFPIGERYHDEFFGEVEIFRKRLDVVQPLSQTQNGQIEVRYQGCTHGFCYPPETVILDLPQQADEKSENVAKNRSITTAYVENTASAQHANLAETLSQNRFSVFWFFVLGVGLAFTPCVLPMLPLLSAIVIGKQQRPNSFKALGLSLAYVQGMALTYTLLGLTIAAIGLPFQIALQHPYVLLGLSLLFVLLALSMFGLFEIRLPHRWQQALNQLSQQQKGGSVFGVFVMGMIAGLIASPCTSAPLSGALLYVAQSGDLWIGGLALYLLALGMGMPLIAMTLFGNRILPRSGNWLLNVKTAFGFVMLAMPIFLFARVFPQSESYLWSGLGIAFLVWLYKKITFSSLLAKALKAVLIIGVALVAKPFTDLVWSRHQTASAYENLPFTRITNLADLNAQLQANSGKKVMLDLYADWCVACKEFEKYTFPETAVKSELANMVLLQVDMTQNSAANDELMKHFQILGLPTILFFDEQGKEMTPSRVTGFMAADTFLLHLQSLSSQR